MQAVVLKAFGAPENFVLEKVPDPKPQRGEVLLQVRACALNHLDIWIRQGLPSSRVKPPAILGCDVAGEVVDIGQGADATLIGRRCAVHPGRSCGHCDACREGRDSDCPDYGIIGAYGNLPGGYAEYLRVPVEHLLVMPEKMSFVDAAALPLTSLTAWHMLVTLADLKVGETLLATGAGSGVTIAAVQIARSLGARVIVTSTSAQKIERAKELGAIAGIRFPGSDLRREVLKYNEGRLVDAVLDHVGPPLLGEALKVLRPSGRLVTCGATAGPVEQIDLRFIFSRQLRIIGARMGNLAEMRRVWELACRGQLKAVVDRTFPLAKAAAAHAALESRGQFGKIVLTI